MGIEYDTAKNRANIEKRGISFDSVAEFDIENSFQFTDERKDYGEKRIVAIGRIGKRLHVLVYVEIETGIRVISLRKANKREVKRYEQKA